MRVLLFLLIFLVPLLARAESYCTPEMKEGTRCRVKIKNLLPTQFSLGMVDVRDKQDQIRQHGTNFLRKNRAQVVIGPGGKQYLIDRHHTMNAAERTGRVDAFAEIAANFSEFNEEEFWRVMKLRKWVRLVDQNGVAKNLKDLPKRLKDLKPDAYRSLAWAVRKSKGFRKTDIPFAEFEWADYFRQRINIEPGKDGWYKAVKEGIRLATERESISLPGHRRVSPKKRGKLQDACWKRFHDLEVDAP